MTRLVRAVRRFRAMHTSRRAFALAATGLCLALVAAIFVVVGQTLAAPASPGITLSPTSGTPSTSLTVNGAGFHCKSVSLTFDTTSVGSASPTKQAFSALITVPNSATVGQHTVTATCPGHKGSSQAQATFDVLSPSADLGIGLAGPINLNTLTRSGACTATISNLGPDPASNVVASFRADPDLVFGVSRTSVGSYDPGTGVWTIGSMRPSSQETLDCTISVAESVQTSQFFRTSYTVSSDTADRDPSNNSGTLTTFFAGQ